MQICLQDTEEVRAEARIHAQLIKSVAATISDSRPSDMEGLCQLVQDAFTQLSILKSGQGAVLLRFQSFPKVTPQHKPLLLLANM